MTDVLLSSTDLTIDQLATQIESAAHHAAQTAVAPLLARIAELESRLAVPRGRDGKDAR